MANENMKRFSASFSILDIQIKTAGRYHFTPSRMTIINRTHKVSVGKGVEELEPSFIDDREFQWFSHFGK